MSPVNRRSCCLGDGLLAKRERYKTQDEILTALRELRKRKMGVDNIVMDWQYWKLIHGEA